jgi:hypothetical protein
MSNFTSPDFVRNYCNSKFSFNQKFSLEKFIILNIIAIKTDVDRTWDSGRQGLNSQNHSIIPYGGILADSYCRQIPSENTAVPNLGILA